MYIKTNLKPKDYASRDVVRIVNPKQYLLYIKNGIYPIDLYTSVDDKSSNSILVMIFLKEDTTEIYQKWCNYDLE